MFTQVMKCISNAGLFLGVLWHPAENYMLLLVVCASALLAAGVAHRSAWRLWGIGFVEIAILFNPIQPWTPSRGTFLWLDLICLATFLTSLLLLGAKPTPPTPLLVSARRKIKVPSPPFWERDPA